MRRFLPRLTYANVMATAAMFVALGGTSYAVTKLPKKSVGTEQLRDQAVTKAKLADGALVPGPAGARGPRGADGPTGPTGAQGPAGGIGQAEAWKPLELEQPWRNFGSGMEPAGYRKDASGTVEIRGYITTDGGQKAGRIATLPPGYRPRNTEAFPVITGSNGDAGTGVVGRVDLWEASGWLYRYAGYGGTDGNFLSLSGIRYTPTH